MLYEFVIQGEKAGWETFKKAEQEAQRRDGLRDDADVGLLRRLIGCSRQIAALTHRPVASREGVKQTLRNCSSTGLVRLFTSRRFSPMGS